MQIPDNPGSVNEMSFRGILKLQRTDPADELVYFQFNIGLFFGAKL